MKNKDPVQEAIEEIDILIGYCSIMEDEIIRIKLERIKNRLKKIL